VNKGMWFGSKVRAALAIKTAGKQERAPRCYQTPHIRFPPTAAQAASLGTHTSARSPARRTTDAPCSGRLARPPHLSPSLPISPHLSPSLPISPHLSPSLPISPHLSGRLARPRAREAGCEERAPPLPVDEQAAGRTDARGAAPCAQALFTPSSCEQAVAMLEALRARLDGAAEAPRRPRAHFTQTHNPAPKTHKHRPSRRERRRRQSEGH